MPADNYAQFIEQLDTAAKKLTARRESLSGSLEIVGLLFEQNELGLRLWEERRNNVGVLVATETKSSEKQKALSELQDVAIRMESMFLNRTQRIAEKQTAIQSRYNEITRSLLDLDRSKLKLESSRMLSRERENLNRAIADLAGTPQGASVSSADLGLRDDLNEARRAIILAEALLEVKEN
jgi:hypothetical protein